MYVYIGVVETIVESGGADFSQTWTQFSFGKLIVLISQRCHSQVSSEIKHNEETAATVS